MEKVQIMANSYFPLTTMFRFEWQAQGRGWFSSVTIWHE